jgi:hypothetical protein
MDHNDIEWARGVRALFDHALKLWSPVIRGARPRLYKLPHDFPAFLMAIRQSLIALVGN